MERFIYALGFLLSCGLLVYFLVPKEQDQLTADACHKACGWCEERAARVKVECLSTTTLPEIAPPDDAAFEEEEVPK